MLNRTFLLDSGKMIPPFVLASAATLDKNAELTMNGFVLSWMILAKVASFIGQQKVSTVKDNSPLNEDSVSQGKQTFQSGGGHFLTFIFNNS